MPKLLGGVTAAVALLAGLFGNVDPVTILQRSGLAFVLGWVAGHVWYVLLAVAAGGARYGRHFDEPAESAAPTQSESPRKSNAA